VTPFAQEHRPEGPRRLAVVGTMVWDTIHDPTGHRAPLQEWGGIGYALGALAAALPEDWEVVPIIKVGRDLAEDAYRFLREIPWVRPEDALVVVPEPNNRVELHYTTGSRRSERLSGGVPPWIWPELASRVRGCDAVYVNFISGYEMDLDAARALRAGYQGPTYADLHSLFLGIGQEGLRVPRPLPEWEDWLGCFDVVQMNEDEFDLLGRVQGDPWALAAGVVGTQLKLICITLAGRGAAYVAGSAFDSDPSTWWETRHRVGSSGPFRSGRVPLDGLPAEGDPTGCGDVWGATFFARLLAGDLLEEAMARANRSAARNVTHRGARGLHLHLAGRLAPGRDQR